MRERSETHHLATLNFLLTRTMLVIIYDCNERTRNLLPRHPGRHQPPRGGRARTRGSLPPVLEPHRAIPPPTRPPLHPLAHQHPAPAVRARHCTSNHAPSPYPAPTRNPPPTRDPPRPCTRPPPLPHACHRPTAHPGEARSRPQPIRPTPAPPSGRPGAAKRSPGAPHFFPRLSQAAQARSIRSE